MLIGVPKEIKTEEYRIGLTPASVRELVHHGHGVIVQAGGGAGIGIGDAVYQAVGARVVDSPAEIYATADLVVKVKEPQPSEYPLLREDLLLFTYLHLAPDPQQTRITCEAVASELGYAYQPAGEAIGGI